MGTLSRGTTREPEKSREMKGNRSGEVVRALASNQGDLGSTNRPAVSLVLVLDLAPRVFSGFSGFPPSTKTNTSKLLSDRESDRHRQDYFVLNTLVKESPFFDLYPII